jgi:hypothetical protein
VVCRGEGPGHPSSVGATLGAVTLVLVLTFSSLAAGESGPRVSSVRSLKVGAAGSNLTRTPWTLVDASAMTRESCIYDPNQHNGSVGAASTKTYTPGLVGSDQTGPGSLLPRRNVERGGVANASASSAQYRVTVTEVGLENGTAWWINVSGGRSSSTTNETLSFNEPNGSYSYSATTADKYYSAPSPGSLTVNGTPRAIKVFFTPPVPGPCSVTFVETGLPIGAASRVTLNNSSWSQDQILDSRLESVFDFLEYGTYEFKVSPNATFAPNPANGTIVIDGYSVLQPVKFTPRASSSHTAPFIPGTTDLLLLLGAAAAIAVMVAAIWNRRRKTPPGTLNARVREDERRFSPRSQTTENPAQPARQT